MARGKDEKRSGEQTGGFQWTQFITYVGSFCVLILVGAVLVGMALGLRPLEQRAALVVSLSPAKVRLTWPMNAVTPDGRPATWLPTNNQEEIEQLAADALGDSSTETFSSDPLERVSTALALSGWFEGEPTVRRLEDNAIEVDGRWRMPGALVRYKGEDYLVSWDGKRMPPVRKAGLEKNFRVIMGPIVGPPTLSDGSPDYATAWPGEDIVASIELLQLIQDKPWFKQVSGVDASDYSAHAKLTLVTPQGTRIVWGGRPSKPLIGEVSTAQKLAHLSQLVHDHKRIDAGYPLIYINAVNLQFDISATAKQP